MLKNILLLASALMFASAVTAQSSELNLYSARHYQTDEDLYNGFTKATGIKINRLDTDDAGLVARLRAEGPASAADVILLVDASRISALEKEGRFLSIRSKTLEAEIPAALRGKPDANGAIPWFGFSTRARVIVYDKTKVKSEQVDTYEKLGEPYNKGKVCIRSGSHPYNLSLFSSMTEHLGDAKAETWLKGLTANLARDPKGGDTDQIKAVASGECQIAVTNSYYVARLMRSDKPEDKAAVDKIAVVFPNQSTWGTHVNIAGGGVAKYSKNRDNAVKFLEYLASPEAQQYFANGNNEWPTAKSVKVANPALQAMSPNGFKSDTVHVTVVGAHQTAVQQMLDRVGLK